MDEGAKLFAEHFSDQFSNQESSEPNLEDSYFSQQQQFVDALSSEYGTDISTDAVTSSTLFVGDLSITCTENDLVELFSQFIEKDHIASAHILRCRTTGTSLCYGFVTITSASSEEEATLIRRELYGMYLFGRNLKLRSAKADSMIPPEGIEVDMPKISIYVKFQATHVSNNGHINEENIRQIFELSDETKSLICDALGGEDTATEVIGDDAIEGDVLSAEKEKLRRKKLGNASIVDISIRKLAIDRRAYCQYGYGFIFYHDNQQGLAAAMHTLQSKGNIQATSASTDADGNPSANGQNYPIMYTLQSSKGLESYLNYIKGTGDVAASSDSVTQFLDKMRPPMATGGAPGDSETVFVRNPDSSFSPAYGQARNRFPRPAQGAFPLQQQQYHPRGAPNYQNPNAFGVQAPFPKPRYSVHTMGAGTQASVPPQAPYQGGRGYYAHARPRAPVQPSYPRPQYAAYQQQQLQQQQYSQMQMQQYHNAGGARYPPRQQYARPHAGNQPVYPPHQQQQARPHAHKAMYSPNLSLVER